MKIQLTSNSGVKCVCKYVLIYSVNIFCIIKLLLLVLALLTDCTALPLTDNIYACSSEDGEKKDHDKAKDEAPPEASVEEKKAPKKRLSLRKEPPEAFTASFFAGLEIYQTKMLVRCFPQISLKTSFINGSCLELQ